ncbi:MAG: DUF423 domain-containing protein [Verrucomicrobiota bacterium JB022]|nr:DUF423 domain-containing protein [Verrucomicrobiota bacterium JB022]
MQSRLTWIAAVVGALGIALGAFGAHALEPQLRELQRLDTWHTATQYHLIHAVALLALAVADGLRPSSRLRVVGYIFTLGVIVFSGSLYLLGFGAPGWFGAITPIGGLAFIAGWALLPWAFKAAPAAS